MPRARTLPLIAAALLAVLAGGILLRTLAAATAGARLKRIAAHHGLAVRWRDLGVTRTGQLRIAGLVLTNVSRGDTVLEADSAGAAIDLGALAALHLDVGAVSMAHARVRVHGAGAAPDSVIPIEGATLQEVNARSERLRHAVQAVVHTLLLPARRLPRLELRDVRVEAGQGDEALVRGVQLAWLSLAPRGRGMDLAAAGALTVERPIPFDLAVHYGADDRLSGGARFALPDSAGVAPETLRVSVDGALTQDRHLRRITLADSTRVWVGRLPFRAGGMLAERGPTIDAHIEADGLTAPAIVASLPGAVLGPLTGLAVRGSFDWRVRFDLDLGHPDSVDFDADVVSHGLALDPARSRLDLMQLHGPFVAAIHLPHDRIVYRTLSDANPFYRPLERIDPRLAYAVVTNEDGGFFHHRGFNTEAIRLATAENLKAGSYRRGAGTITMQIARNLWLGHRRTLSRKAQEVVLAWVLEHLTGLSKERLLEIYLNIIEWGPGVHGAAEATRFYFDEDPAQVTVDEALFLTTLVPSPTRWRGRFQADGSLRRWTRAQMHFIGRAMVGRGWLAAEVLPPSDAMHVELRGQARAILQPVVRPDTTRRDSLGIEVMRHGAGDPDRAGRPRAAGHVAAGRWTTGPASMWPVRGPWTLDAAPGVGDHSDLMSHLNRHHHAHVHGPAGRGAHAVAGRTD